LEELKRLGDVLLHIDNFYAKYSSETIIIDIGAGRSMKSAESTNQLDIPYLCDVV